MLSVKTATNCAESVMWMGPCQQALFVVSLQDAKVRVVDYDEVLLARGCGIDPIVHAVVIPGVEDGECTILT